MRVDCTDASFSNRTCAQIESAICVTGARSAVATRDAREQNTASAEKAQHPGPYRRARREEQPQACSASTGNREAGRESGAAIGQEESEAEQVCIILHRGV